MVFIILLEYSVKIIIAQIDIVVSHISGIICPTVTSNFLRLYFDRANVRQNDTPDNKTNHVRNISAIVTITLFVRS
jgi:hypothetical protein